jgi:hypothetical protein
MSTDRAGIEGFSALILFGKEGALRNPVDRNGASRKGGVFPDYIRVVADKGGVARMHSPEGHLVRQEVYVRFDGQLLHVRYGEDFRRSGIVFPVALRHRPVAFFSRIRKGEGIAGLSKVEPVHEGIGRNQDASFLRMLPQESVGSLEVRLRGICLEGELLLGIEEEGLRRQLVDQYRKGDQRYEDQPFPFIKERGEVMDEERGVQEQDRGDGQQVSFLVDVSKEREKEERDKQEQDGCQVFRVLPVVAPAQIHSQKGENEDDPEALPKILQEIKRSVVSQRQVQASPEVLPVPERQAGEQSGRHGRQGQSPLPEEIGEQTRKGEPAGRLGKRRQDGREEGAGKKSVLCGLSVPEDEQERKEREKDKEFVRTDLPAPSDVPVGKGEKKGSRDAYAGIEQAFSCKIYEDDRGGAEQDRYRPEGSGIALEKNRAQQVWQEDVLPLCLSGRQERIVVVLDGPDLGERESFVYPEACLPEAVGPQEKAGAEYDAKQEQSDDAFFVFVHKSILKQIRGTPNSDRCPHPFGRMLGAGRSWKDGTDPLYLRFIFI